MTDQHLLGRFAVDSLRGEWHRRILRDRSAAIAEWNRNLRLAALPVIDPTDEAIDAEYDLLAERKAWRGHIRLIDLLDARYLRYRTERLSLIDVMSREPHNEGRGQVVGTRVLANGTETRHSERWQPSISGQGIRAARALGSFVAGVTGHPSIDPTVCVSIRPDGSRVPFVAAKRGKRAKAPVSDSAAIGAAGRYDRMVSLYGIDTSAVDTVG